jgi:methylmalonyl-CoA mutase N-terminal domain/subunit
MIAAINQGYPQTEIARASYEFQQQVERGEAVIVGVNKFQSKDEKPIETLKIDRSATARQCEKLHRLRKERHNEEVDRSLKALRLAAEGNCNLMPLLLDAVRSYATVGEICDVLRGTFGTWEERPNI